EKDVRRLDVPVNDAALVQGSEAGTQLEAVGGGFRDRELASLLELLAQVLARQPLHGDVRHPAVGLGRSAAVDGGYVGALNDGQVLRFRCEPSEKRRVGMGKDELDRDGAI